MFSAGESEVREMTELEMLWHNGRFVSKSTAWWWTTTKIPYDQLYCLHDVKISEKCGKCQRKEETHEAEEEKHEGMD